MMAITEISLFIITIFPIIFIYVWKRSKLREIKTSLPTNYPLVGMLPAILQNCHRIHAYFTEILIECGGTFQLKFPRVFNMDMLLTCDPANIHHIFSRNFSNYPKGPEFKKIFEILGDGIVSTDFELWEFHRRNTLAFFSHPKFSTLLERSVWEKVETGLIPVLDNFSRKGVDFDLQDVFQRFAFDSICKLLLRHDPRSLCLELPHLPSEKGFTVMTKALLYRHLLPESIWKLQKWLEIGEERKLSEVWKAFDEFIYPLITTPSKEGDHHQHDDEDHNLLTSFRKAYEERNGPSFVDDPRDFLRDTVLSLMFAGRDSTSTTLTWLFWLIATNPSTEIKILEEIETELIDLKQDKKWRFFNMEESHKLIYLHGALCESLRLFPPISLEHKAPIQPDNLPSGNHLKPNAKVIVSFYSTGRMESIWGKDCLEFKPERWIISANNGRGIKHEPSYKFPAFNAGPRTCLGKTMALAQMKMVAATIMYRYKIQLVEGHPVTPCDSVILQAKHGLKIRLSKRIV